MQPGAGPRPSLLSQPNIGVAPRAHPARGVDLSAQMLTFHNIHLGCWCGGWKIPATCAASGCLI
jgi:hypothetical protein